MQTCGAERGVTFTFWASEPFLLAWPYERELGQQAIKDGQLRREYTQAGRWVGQGPQGWDFPKGVERLTGQIRLTIKVQKVEKIWGQRLAQPASTAVSPERLDNRTNLWKEHQRFSFMDPSDENQRERGERRLDAQVDPGKVSRKVEQRGTHLSTKDGETEEKVTQVRV